MLNNRLNSRLKSRQSLLAMAALLVGVVAVSRVFDPPVEPPKQTQEKPPEPPPASAQESTAQQGEKEKETERFVPSQKTSADNSATFPVDI